MRLGARNTCIKRFHRQILAKMSEHEPHHVFPFRGVALDEKTQLRIAKHFRGCPSGLKMFNHWGFKLAATTTEEEVERLYNHPLDRRDVWVVTPPKCGTTWTQEMVWLIANDLDYQGAKCPLLGPSGRWSFIDLPVLVDKKFASSAVAEDGSRPMQMMVDCMSGDNKRSSPRFVKSHLPLSMNNPQLLDVCKVIYVARNPKDACVSFYHHCRLYKGHDFTEDFEVFMDLYMAGNIVETPMVEHMVEAWNLRYHPNMCLLFYEDMKRDLRSQIRKVTAFLDKQLTDEQVEGLAEHLHIDNFKKNPNVNMENGPDEMTNPDRGTFIRKGRTGDWKNHFSAQMNSRFDNWLQMKLQGTDLKFVMELDDQD